jgi:hypothetical protein
MCRVVRRRQSLARWTDQRNKLSRLDFMGCARCSGVHSGMTRGTPGCGSTTGVLLSSALARRTLPPWFGWCAGVECLAELRRIWLVSCRIPAFQRDHISFVLHLVPKRCACYVRFSDFGISRDGVGCTCQGDLSRVEQIECSYVIRNMMSCYCGTWA